MLISEIFGPTFQGEGPSVGRRCFFVRLANCNLECVWCDTPYTWAFTQHKADKHSSGIVFNKAEQTREMSVEDIVVRLLELSDDNGPSLVVVSGGEPLMQQVELLQLAKQLGEEFCTDIHVETAGTIAPIPGLWTWIDQWVVSPKLLNSMNVLTKRRKPEVLSEFVSHSNVCFKFVVSDDRDFFEIDEIVTHSGIDGERVFIMPEGIKPEAVLEGARAIADKVLASGFNLSLRQHVLVWPKEDRGR